MDARKEERWATFNAKDTLLNGLLVAAFASLLLHVLSAGTVEVPMTNGGEGVVNDTPLEYPFA